MKRRDKAILDNPKVIFFNQNLEPLTKCNIVDDDAWCELYRDSYYINIPSVICFNRLIKAYHEFLGGRFTYYDVTNNNKMGLWRYNCIKGCWENLTKIKAETDEILEQANKVVLNEEEKEVQEYIDYDWFTAQVE